MAAVISWVGCTLIGNDALSGKPSESDLGGTGGAGAMAGAAGIGGSQAGSAGMPGGHGGSGGAECAEPSDCPGEDSDCRYRSCDGGVCGIHTASAGESCDEAGGTVCDGAGNCVECVTEDQCTGGMICLAQHCYPAHCGDDMQSDGETDVDCGGECPPCGNGKHCLLAADCTSRFCDSSAGVGGAGGAGGSGGAAGSGGAGGGGSQPFGTCAPCDEHGDCVGAPGTYCEAGVCTDQKSDGQPCTDLEECSSGYCVNDVCCSEAACDDCEDCHLSGTEGSCAVVSQGEPGDPICAPYLCDGQSGTCPNTCTVHTACTNGNYCDATGHCAPTLPNGQPCTENEACISGQCIDERCCESPCGSDCVACSADKTNGADGDCLYVSAWTDPDGECPPYELCDGAGVCRKKPDGMDCSSGLECDSTHCVEDLCCDTACTGLCQACQSEYTGSADGSCAPVLQGMDPQGDCNTNERCSGSGTCMCGWVVPAPGDTSCPAPCTSCDFGTNTCIVDCLQNNECEGQTLTCPPGWNCEVTCAGEASCRTATIQCPADYTCEVNCSCDDPVPRCCQSAQIQCSTPGKCDLYCGSGTQACGNTVLDCGDNQCVASCHALVDQVPQVQCDNSCSCISC